MNILRRSTLATVLLLSASATGDMTGFAYQNGYAWSGIDFGGSTVSGYVVDLYLEFDEPTDILLNVYDYNDINVSGPDNPDYFQGLTAQGWAPNEQGAPFTTDVSQSFDSFIAIGGVTEYDDSENPFQMGANSVNVDPSFGQGNSTTGNNSANPGSNGGWYNGSPPNGIGQVIETSFTNTGFGVFIGRFSILDSEGFTLEDSTGFATFNQGVGTKPGQSSFVVVPAPGALAVLSVASLASRRRRSN